MNKIEKLFKKMSYQDIEDAQERDFYYMLEEWKQQINGMIEKNDNNNPNKKNRAILDILMVEIQDLVTQAKKIMDEE